MVKKTCPACGKNSYSAAEEGQWICPYCKTDMTNVPKKAANVSTKPKNNKNKKLGGGDWIDQMCP